MTPADVLAQIGGWAAAAAVAVCGWLFNRVVKRHDEDIGALKTLCRHLEISNARIEEQLKRYSADIESEKRTRAEVNREIFSRLDRLLERRSEDRD